jgi:pimeloyl-ACP methyl ester carboxylesterase
MALSRWAAAPVLALFVLVVPAGQAPAGGEALERPADRAALGTVGLSPEAAAVSDCTPVPAECGTVRVPLDWSRPDRGSIDVAYALLRHRDQSSPAAGTVVPNPGGPGDSAIEFAPLYAEAFGELLVDHDLLLIDPRGTGQSGPIQCGVPSLPATRDGLTRAIAECGSSLGVRARYYTSAATADDIDAVRAHLRIPRLDLLGESYGTYLMTVYAQRHPDHIRSIVLSSAFPLAFDMWARPNARAVQRAIRLMCERSAGKCDGERALAELAQLAQQLRQHPIPYQVPAEAAPRVLDETALAGIVYNAGMDLGQLPAIVGAALAGDTAPLVAAAQALVPLSGSSAEEGGSDLALAFAVGCNDFPTLWNRHAPVPVRLRQFAAGRAALPVGTFYPFSARAWTSAIIDRGNTCIRWPDRHGPVQRTSGPFADVPVLILSGDLDPNTPTEEGHLAARQFRDSRVIEVPNVGHVPESHSGCPAAILMNFIRTLQVGDTSCLADIPPIPVT